MVCRYWHSVWVEEFGRLGSMMEFGHLGSEAVRGERMGLRSEIVGVYVFLALPPSMEATSSCAFSFFIFMSVSATFTVNRFFFRHLFTFVSESATETATS